MGSWNATCGLSNLPVMENDKVALFILEGKHKEVVLGGDGFSSSNALFEPIIPIFATYNDYGRYIDIEEKNKDLVNAHIKYKLSRGEYVCKKDGVDADSMTLEDFIELVKEGYMYNNELFDEIVPMGFMVIHKDIYENIMKSINASDWDFNMINKSYQYGVSEIKEYEKGLRECFVDIPKEELEDKIRRMLGLKNVDFPYAKTMKNIIMKIYTGELGEEAEEEVLKLGYMNKVFYKLRKTWMPQAGLGSQECYDELYLVLANSIIEKYNKYEEECEY